MMIWLRWLKSYVHNIPIASSSTMGIEHQERGGAIPISVDFLSVKNKSRGHAKRQELIARAVGLKSTTVIDAAAGFGRDAFVLARLGYQVQMIERSPIIAQLLEDGLARLIKEYPKMHEQLSLIQGDARELLTQLPKVDVIYLDPMHPPRKKNALVKKEMRILRQIVGDDADRVELFHTALTHAKHRVVIKLPINASTIDDRAPSLQFKGKHTRFDVYLVRS